jgi:hypothetical protein
VSKILKFNSLPIKTIKRTLWGFLIVVILLALIVFSIRLRSVQTWVVNRILAGIEQKYDGKISVGKVLVRWPHRIELDHILILDRLNDTLLFSPSISLSVNKLDLDKNRLSLGKVIIEDPVVHVRQLPSGQMNHEILLEALASGDSTAVSKPFSLTAGNIVLRKGVFQYRMFGAIAKPGQVQWDNLLFTNIELAVKQFELDGQNVKAVIDQLSFNELSGFSLNKFSARLVVDSKGIRTENLVLMTGNSRIESVSASAMGIWNQKGVQDELFLDVVLGVKTYLGPADLILLSGVDTGINTPMEISGVFNGSLKNARLLYARVNWPDLISFDGDLLYNYPGKLQEAFFDLKTRSLNLNMSNLVRDLLSGQIPDFQLTVPDALANLDIITYAGIFTGTFENFITTGNWSINNNEFATNLQVNKNKPFKGFNFKGTLAATGLNPDLWVKEPIGLSELEFYVDVDGVWDGEKSVTALIIGEASQFSYSGYTFQHLAINGQVSQNQFDGLLNLRDPNLVLDLEGQFDFSQDLPVIDFNLLLYKADLYALKLVKNDTISTLQVNMRGSFTGKDIDEIDGEIKVLNSSYTNSNGTLPVSELTLSAIPELGRRKIILSSEFLDARVVGSVHIDDLVDQAKSLVARFVPAITETQPARPEHLNDFAFNIQIKNAAPVTKVLLPSFQFKDNTRLAGFYKAENQTISIEGASPQFVSNGSQFTEFDLLVQTKGDSLMLFGKMDKIQLDRNTIFEAINLNASLVNNQLNALLNWNEAGKTGTRGTIGCIGTMSQSEDGQLKGVIRFPSAEIVYNDSTWKLNPFQILADRDKIRIDHFVLAHGDEMIDINGSISNIPSDTLHVGFNNVNLKTLSSVVGSDDFVLQGRLTGAASFFDLRNKGMFLTEARIDSLSINGQPMGHTTLSSRSAGSGEPLLMDILIQRGAIKTLILKGEYNPANNKLDFDLHVDKLRMDIANPFVNDDLRDVKGLATGHVKISGTRNEPLINGEILMQKASFIVDYLNSRFYFTHKVVISPDAFSITGLDMQDEEGNHAYVTGAVRHNKFNNIRLDLDMSFKDFLLLNEIESRNMGYWGRGYCTGVGSIKGELRTLVIDVSARSSSRTKFFIPVYTQNEARKIDFVTYVEKPKEETDVDLLDFSVDRKKGYEVNLYGATVNIDLDVTPDAEVQLIFDSKVGDLIHATGSGNLRVFIPPTSGWTLNGDYTIDQGDYQFTIQNMPVKKLQIEPGATLKWTGEVSNAELDINAVYRTKASLYDLLQDESNPDLTQRIPVECHLLMSGFLQMPALDYAIVLPPSSNDIARTQLQNLSREEVSRQVISLLLLNRFTPLQGTGTGSAGRYENAGLATATEVFSNQLNYWLSQITKDFDVGFNYRPGDQLTSDEVEVALSAPFLNNRMNININGNYDVRPSTSNTSQLVGDVEVEYKIKQSGKVRMKAFTRANDHLLYEYAPYSHGVGIFYREEFDTFKDLLQKYREKWFRK